MHVIRYRLLCAALFVLPSALAQSGATDPKAKVEFEVASIRPAAPITSPQVSAGVHIDDARVRFVMLSLKEYIAMAFKVRLYQVSGPEWLNQRFDINATVPENSKREQLPEMMQSLLAERFGMKFHRASKEFSVYGLVLAKGGLKITPVEAAVQDAESSAKPINVAASGSRAGTMVNFGNGSSIAFGGNKIEARKITMPQLAETLARFNDRPVIDGTGVSGKFDFTLEFTPEDFQAMMIRSAISAGVALPPQAIQYAERASGDSLGNALANIGVKLESKKAPLDVVVVDEIRKTPTEN